MKNNLCKTNFWSKQEFYTRKSFAQDYLNGTITKIRNSASSECGSDSSCSSCHCCGGAGCSWNSD